MLQLEGKRIQLVFCDMDGTFLTSDKHVTQENIRTVQKLANEDVLFVPCTGRMRSGIPAELAGMNEVRYLVCSMGATIYQRRGADFTVALSGSIDTATVQALYANLAPYEVQFDVFCSGRSYSEKARLEKIGEYPINPGMMGFILEQRVPIDEDVPSFLRDGKKVERLNVYYKNPADRLAIQEILKSFPELGYTFHDGCGIEIINRNYTKGSALRWICRHEGVPAEETLAIGDGENDIAMFAEAGIACAMENADPGCKNAAQIITEFSNDEDGVARFIESYLS
ncbi:HAD family hydrolase [Olsenella sp. AGMB03486]|uniref:HAD family hydrolase n=1 Tax=Olsenella sp. AGMB03486 TaxID=3230364 RepID=UPI0034A01581